MLRKEAIDEVGVYGERFKRAQDHEYFLRMLEKGWKIANLQEVLTQYRIHKKEGVHGRSRASLWYGFLSRARFLFKRDFFSVKGCIMTVGYFVASILPRRLTSLAKRYFFTGYDV